MPLRPRLPMTMASQLSFLAFFQDQFGRIAIHFHILSLTGESILFDFPFGSFQYTHTGFFSFLPGCWP